MPLLSPEINILEKVCSKASKIIIRDFGEVEKLQVSKKGPGDFVTKTDKKVEKIIIEELNRARPTYGFIAEESGSNKSQKSEFNWIIDPNGIYTSCSCLHLKLSVMYSRFIIQKLLCKKVNSISPILI